MMLINHDATSENILMQLLKAWEKNKRDRKWYSSWDMGSAIGKKIWTKKNGMKASYYCL